MKSRVTRLTSNMLQTEVHRAEGMLMRTTRVVSMLLLCSFIPVASSQTPNDPGEPGVITGNVIDSVGKSVPGAKVYVREHNMPQRGSVRYVITDESGQFRVGDLRPGDYDVYAAPSQSSSMLSRWSKRVRLPKDKPIGRVTIQMGSAANRQG